MAEAVVSIALETLRDLLLEEGRFLPGVSGEVKGLETQLKEMKCLLEDADRRQHRSKTVRNWIAKIRELSHRAIDAIEIYAVEVSPERGRGLRRLFNGFFSIGRQIGSEISEIKSELARITKNMQEYGIRNIIQGESSSNDENQKWLRQTFPFEIEDCFVGKEDELKQLVSLVVDDKQHRVISLWGMGGIGKTTITRKVYNHDATKRAFDSFAWVCITQQCHIRSVLQDVLNQLTSKKRDYISSLSNTELIEQLCEVQKVKRCMIVVDDLWEIDHWDGMKHAVLVQGSKSKILVTTRNQKVADHLGLAFELELLRDGDSLELLKNKAFPHSNIPDNAFEEELLQKFGEKMVQKCGYLPLAVSLLGGILSKKKSMREWELVNENIDAYLYRGEGLEMEGGIRGVLNLSYEDLPYYLKSCFLYMSQFKEDWWMSTELLCKMWIALGMISHEHQGKDETLMDIAELYLSELASRCIIQVQVQQYAAPGEKYRLCMLHDVVRDLCLLKVKEEGFGSPILDYQGGNFSTFLHDCLSGTKTRHLAINFQSEMERELERDELTITRDEETSKHVQSLRFINFVHPTIFEFPHIVDLQKFKLLKLLVFRGFKFAGQELARKIGGLIHLRHLGFLYCKLDELPSSIDNLVYLYNLDLTGTSNVRVPNVLKNMYRLKHLSLPDYDPERIGNYRLKMDEGLDQLETLYGFDSSVHEVRSITRMKSLQNLLAVIRDNVSLLAIINVLDTTNWKNLRNCSIEIAKGCKLTSIEEGLVSLRKVFTCHNLHELCILVHMGRLLRTLGNQITTSELVNLKLYGCEIEDDPMEILGKLPFLQELYLLGRSFVGKEIKCHASGFPRLRNLQLSGLSNLREWRVEEGTMLILSQIQIEYCPHLKMVPDGLRFINTLKQLFIVGMPELGNRIAYGGQDFDKVQHVPHIIIN